MKLPETIEINGHIMESLTRSHHIEIDWLLYFCMTEMSNKNDSNDCSLDGCIHFSLMF